MSYSYSKWTSIALTLLIYQVYGLVVGVPVGMLLYRWWFT